MSGFLNGAIFGVNDDGPQFSHERAGAFEVLVDVFGIGILRCRHSCVAQAALPDPHQTSAVVIKPNRRVRSTSYTSFGGSVDGSSGMLETL